MMDMASPNQLNLTGRGCSHQPGHTCPEFHISSIGASGNRALTTGVQALFHLSYRMGIKRANLSCYDSEQCGNKKRPSKFDQNINKHPLSKYKTGAAQKS